MKILKESEDNIDREPPEKATSKNKCEMRKISGSSKQILAKIIIAQLKSIDAQLHHLSTTLVSPEFVVEIMIILII